MDDRRNDKESQIAADERELKRLEKEKNRLVASPHHGFADASSVNRLDEQIQALDTKIIHEREERNGRS